MGWTAVVRFPARARDLSLLHSVKTGTAAHPAYQMDTDDHPRPSTAKVKNDLHGTVIN
jgi:hypothetical protein